MIGFKVDGQILEIPASAEVGFILKNTAFLRGNANVLPGSFSLPVTVNLDDATNNEVLGYPGLVDSIDNLAKNLPCEFIVNGFPLFLGTMDVMSATKTTARVKMVINEVKQLKSTKLSELSNLETHSFANVAAVLTHAKDTADNPLNHNHLFCPVYNPDFFDEETDPDPDDNNVYKNFQNYYDTTGQAFISDAEHKAAMPFIRLDYVLDKIIDEIGYTFVNGFQSTDELKQLYLYNNKSIYSGDDWALDFDYVNHLPAMKATDLFKFVARTFNQGVFTDVFNKEVEYKPMKDVLASSPVHDWTDKAGGYTTSPIGDVPEYFGYDTDSNDNIFSTYEYEEIPFFIEVENYSDLPTSGLNFNWYYVRSRNTFYFVSTLGGSQQISQVKKMFRREKTTHEGAPFEAKVVPLFQRWPSSGALGYVPECRINGESKLTKARLFFYRGQYQGGDSNNYPFATNSIYDWQENTVSGAEHSLLWNGDKGLANTWFKNYIAFLDTSKPVSRKIDLHITDLLNFSFADKVRITNYNYFVYSIKLSFGQTGLKPADVKLISTT